MVKLIPRPPVVVVLGHVDHGKTTLLDYLKKTRKTEEEVGGITQSIGAYEVPVNIKDYEVKKITFIDTPGHEAFSKLRLRGADVADIAILIVDASDSVMPQTVESLYHIRNAEIPFIVCANKIDLPTANIDRVKKDLMKEGVLFEGGGGDVPFVSISAKKGTGIEELLETILFIASLKELRYSPDNLFKAYIIESRKDKVGVVASVIIKDGTLKQGDEVYALSNKAKIKAMINDQGKHIEKVFPSTPFLLLGFKELPEVGVALTNMPQIVSQKKKEEEKKIDMKNFFGEEKQKKLKIIIKTDSNGSLEAILSSASGNENIEITLAAVGSINKSDIYLAKMSQSVIVGFAIPIDKNIVELAEQEKVVIKSYSIIYQLLEELTEVSHLLKEKETKEKQVKGEGKILATFIIEKEKIAGFKVLKGKINLNDQIELYRDERLVGKAKIVSLKTRAKTITEVKKNEEGGMIIYPQLDFHIGDLIKSHSI